MANTNVWARGQWDLNLMVSLVGDRDREGGSPGRLYKLALSFLLFQTRCLACEPCRKYYSQHVVSFQEARMTSDNCAISLTNFTHAMNRFVAAKIAGGEGEPLNVTLGNVLQLRQRYSTLSIRSIMTTEAICDVFLLQLLQARKRSRSAAADSARQTRLRVNYIWYSFLVVISLFQKELPEFTSTANEIIHRICDPAVATGGLQAMKEEVVFGIIHQVRNALPDVPAETVDATRTRLGRAFRTTAKWLTTFQ